MEETEQRMLGNEVCGKRRVLKTIVIEHVGGWVFLGGRLRRSKQTTYNTEVKCRIR